MMFVLLVRRSDPWIRVRCADYGCIIHDSTTRKKPLGLARARERKLQHLRSDTLQEASTAVDGPMHLCGSLAHCWLLAMAILKFQSLKTRGESSVVSVLAEAVPGEGKNKVLVCFVATPTCSKYDGKVF